jgi:hydroxymethylglutaryl-CoA reductase (NADPH)
MRGSNLLPKQLRSLGGHDSWLSRSITSTLLSTSSLACQHPIHTLVVIALLASTSYVGLLQESLFDTTGQTRNGRVDVASLLEGSRTLELSSRTSWRWHVEDDHSFDNQEKVRTWSTPAEYLSDSVIAIPAFSAGHIYIPRLVYLPSRAISRNGAYSE